MLKKFILLSIFFSINCAIADNEKDKNDIQLAMKDVLQIEGKATAEDSARFWARIPKGQDTQKAVETLINEYLTPANKVQHQMWTCIRKSWVEKSKQKCEEALNYIFNTEKKLGAENFDAKKITRNLNVLVEAASNNLASVEIDSVRLNLSLEIIEKTTARIDNAIKNAKFVLENQK